MSTVTLGCEHCTVHVDDNLHPLPDTLQQRGGSPQLLRSELLHLITEQINNHPRSLQTRIGPSEMGTPCVRRIGYRLLDTPEANPRTAAWKPTVGTAVHAWLEQAFTNTNNTGVERFYLEQTVTVGQVNGVDITGNCDLYDRVTATVVDWKVVGLAGLRRYKKDGPGEQYRTQAHLYGRGWRNAGLPVDTVAVMFLPQNGELADAHLWAEPYNEQIALDALTRVGGVAALTSAAGPAALPLLPTADSYCGYCPWYRADTTDLTRGCPGEHGSASAHAVAAPATLADALH